MSKYYIDTSAWVAYFDSNPCSEEIKNLIENEEIMTSMITIAELADRATRNNILFSDHLKFIKNRAKILPITIPIVLKAATYKQEIRKKNSKFGLVDAIHYATAKDKSTTLLTLDNDFRGIEGAEVFE
jgi:predicted nucleic acid-binding protein